MTGPHWTDAYYGDLYFDSSADLLTPGLSEAEAGVIQRLLRLRPGARVLDLACGHGRHAWPLAALGARVVGLERSARYLGRAAAAGGRSGFSSGAWAPAWLRGDVRDLPLRGGSVDAAFSWYSSLFMFDDAVNVRCLAEMGRVVRPGGRLLVHHANPMRLALDPVASSRRVLADGSVVEEESRWDPAAGVDRCARRLVRPDGAALAGTAELRYYSPAEWGPLAQAGGLRLTQVTSTTCAGSESVAQPESEALDLIAVLEKPRRGAG
ncbi:MAG: class I SAM-dependent methyltransferase [Anaeromyxobacteraceae bacterium]